MIYKTSEAQRRAAKKYNEKHREKIKTYQKTYHKNYFAKNREKYLEASKRYTLAHPFKIKQRVFKLLGGETCIKCGCKDIRILEINHINGGGQAEAKRKYRETGKKYGNRDLSWDIIMGRRDASEFNVLCRLCNTLDYLYRKYGKESIIDSYKNAEFKVI